MNDWLTKRERMVHTRNACERIHRLPKYTAFSPPDFCFYFFSSSVFVAPSNATAFHLSHPPTLTESTDSFSALMWVCEMCVWMFGCVKTCLVSDRKFCVGKSTTTPVITLHHHHRLQLHGRRACHPEKLLLVYARRVDSTNKNYTLTLRRTRKIKQFHNFIKMKTATPTTTRTTTAHTTTVCDYCEWINSLLNVCTCAHTLFRVVSLAPQRTARTTDGWRAGENERGNW